MNSLSTWMATNSLERTHEELGFDPPGSFWKNFIQTRRRLGFMVRESEKSSRIAADSTPRRHHRYAASRCLSDRVSGPLRRRWRTRTCVTTNRRHRPALQQLREHANPPGNRLPDHIRIHGHRAVARIDLALQADRSGFVWIIGRASHAEENRGDFA